MVDIEHRWLQVYGHSPKTEGEWFFAISAFRHRWEFGLTRDYQELGRDLITSRYYIYAQRVNDEGRAVDKFEFPRKNRWSHVIS